jgi:SAM-dependent methyltransferase
MPNAIRSWLRIIKTKVGRKLGIFGGSWETGLPHELGFWRGALRENGVHWHAEQFRFRTDPSAPLQPELCALLADAPAHVRILDVGAGPLTMVGKSWPGREVEITAVDPLADEYDKILAENGITPPARTTVAEGEKLDARFAPDTFDMAYASNSLDHCKDPLVTIKQMLRVVKPGGWVYLWHFANEGIAERYSGLHQWNFDVSNGTFSIDGGGRAISLGAELEGQAALSTEDTHAFGKRVVIAKLRKLPRA